jgi:peptidoglycan/LPS O-acetylase OafA/YrhL
MTDRLPASAYQLGYRSDIEGLRAVAILLVVAAHARVPPFAGGFVGVDVFFVLSGYLITGLLVREVQTKGQLDFAAFYARRLRRLLPGLLLMIGCTAVLGHLLLGAGQQPELAKAAASAALWVSNFYFAFDNLDYFGPSSETNLLLHTWSLGVEEQFYIVWPLILVLATGAWAGARRPPDARSIKIVMPLILVVGLMACVCWTWNDPALAFYMMPARSWQFALGALVFAWFGSPAQAANLGGIELKRSAPSWLGWLGLAVILCAGVLLNPRFTYPWPWGLAPSLGAAAILAAGANAPAEGAGKLLSMRPLQAIGRTSYSWYLWHWPSLLLGASLFPTHGIVTRLTLALVSYLAASAAAAWVERPVRRNKALIRHPAAAVAGGAIAMIVAGSAATAWHAYTVERMHEPQQMRFISIAYDAPIIYGLGCDSWNKGAAVIPCTFGPPDAPHTAVIIGDSVALQWFPAVAHVFKAPDWRLVVLTMSACPMVDAPVFYARFRRVYVECGQWRSGAVRQIAQLKPDIVLMGSSYAYDLTRSQWVAGTASLLKPLSVASGRVFILRSTPRLPFDAVACLAQRSDLFRSLIGDDACSASAANPQGDAVYSWLAAAASDFPNVSLIDMTSAICPNGTCHAERDGVLVFRDSQHLTTRFVESLTGELTDVLKRDTPGLPISLHTGADTSGSMPQSTP